MAFGVVLLCDLILLYSEQLPDHLLDGILIPSVTFSFVLPCRYRLFHHPVILQTLRTGDIPRPARAIAIASYSIAPYALAIAFIRIVSLSGMWVVTTLRLLVTRDFLLILGKYSSLDTPTENGQDALYVMGL
jgi:hypothetical protein